MNRRKVDVDLTDIKVTLGKIESHIDQQKDLHLQCLVDRGNLYTLSNQNSKDISILESRQKFIMGIGSFIGATWIAAMAKWISAHMGK